MNGNIYWHSLASVSYSFGWCTISECNANAIPPAPPANISTITGEPIFVQSYINAYNTAFNQPDNSQRALYNYYYFAPDDTNGNYVPGTFGSFEEYNNIGERFRVRYLGDNLNNYDGNPYLFISAGSGGGSGFMYLDWVIVTYGVPYVVSVS